MAKAELVAKPASNSHYETDFGVSSAVGAGNTKIGFLKARLWQAFKKPIFIIRIAGSLFSKCQSEIKNNCVKWQRFS
jgi:hypothetical protein